MRPPGWAALAAFAGGIAFFIVVAALTREASAALIVAIRGFFAECAIFIIALAVVTARRARTGGSDLERSETISAGAASAEAAACESTSRDTGPRDTIATDAVSTALLAAVAAAGGFSFPVPAILAAGVLARQPALILDAAPLWLAMLVASPLLPGILWLWLRRTGPRGGSAA